MAFYYNNDFKEQVAGKGMSVLNTFVLDNRTGKYGNNVISGEDKINESLYTILSTRIGERLFLPSFGSKLHTIIFEQNTLIRADLARLYTEEAIKKWEKRVNVVSVEVGDLDMDTNTLPIIIYYKIANSNISGSYIYPFNVGDGIMIHEFE